MWHEDNTAKPLDCSRIYNTNKSGHVWRETIVGNIFVQITFETGKRDAWFYILTQGVPEGRTSEGEASFKEAKPRSWHVDVVPGFSAVGLVTNKELCHEVWGFVIKNFTHQYTVILSELLRKV